MADKPGFNVASGFQGGVTVGISADSWQEFVGLCQQVWGDQGLLVAQGLYNNLRSYAGTVEAGAVAALESQMGGQVQQVRLPDGYQQQVPQGYASQPPPVQPQVIDNGPPPGQTCDPTDPTKTKWVKAGVSKKTGKPYPGFWARP